MEEIIGWIIKNGQAHRNTDHPWTVAATEIYKTDEPCALKIQVTCCWPPPLSLMETWALSLPASNGLKVTVMVQDFPAPTLEPQVLV
jgi:hypothetical protein